VQTTLDGSQQTTTDTQTYHGKPVAPHKLYTELMEAKAKGKAGWWPKFRVALVPAEKKLPSRLQAMLQCIDCETYVSGTNPSEIARTHFKKVGEGSKVEYVCKVKGNINKPQPVKLVPGKRLAVAQGGLSSSSAGPVGTSETAGGDSQGSNQGGSMFGAAIWQQQQAVRHLVKFLIKHSTLSAIEDVDLKQAFATFGCELPGEILFPTFLAVVLTGRALVCGTSLNDCLPLLQGVRRCSPAGWTLCTRTRSRQLRSACSSRAASLAAWPVMAGSARQQSRARRCSTSTCCTPTAAPAS
jgi:hypothetical protein